MFCIKEFCIAYSMIFYIGIAIIGIIVFVVMLFRKRTHDELSLGGQLAQPNPSYVREEDQPEVDDSEEYTGTSAKVGDKLPFEDWVLEVTGIDDEEEQIWGNLIVILPNGAKFLNLVRQHSDDYPASVLGFNIIYVPADGTAVAATITYDPDPEYPPMYEDYDMQVAEIFVHLSESPSE